MSAHRNRHQAIGTREGDGDPARSLDQGRHRHIDRSSRSPEEERPDTGGRGHLRESPCRLGAVHTWHFSTEWSGWNVSLELAFAPRALPAKRAPLVQAVGIPTTNAGAPYCNSAMS